MLFTKLFRRSYIFSQSMAWLCFPPSFVLGGATPFGGWGVDAVLSRHIAPANVSDYLSLLSDSGVGIVRERGTRLDPAIDQAPWRCFKEIKGRGFHVLAFSQEGMDMGATSWGPWPSDLGLVYSNGFRLGHDFAEVVDAWELHNEPELAWWSDMPDRYAAHAAALYLGLKAGARKAGVDTPVLLGALGLAPGPWLERVASCGVLGFADAWNIHYYGEASQFSAYLRANLTAMRELDRAYVATTPKMRWVSKRASFPFSWRDVSRRLQPIWVTECGLKTVTPATWGDPVRRWRQADFIVSTAAQALAEPGVAVFMPFVLVHKDDPYALSERSDAPWPAWNQYARFTRDNPWPERSTIRPPAWANPVVLQWLADPKTATGLKTAGTYRWKVAGKPIRGDLRVYNFGDKPVHGRLYGCVGDEPGWGLKGVEPWQPIYPLYSRRSQAVSDFITLLPGASAAIPTVFPCESAPAPGRRVWRQYWFETREGRRSPLGFGLEQVPSNENLACFPLRIIRWQNEPTWSLIPNYAPGEGSGAWRTINGVRVQSDREDALARFEITASLDDPEHPPMAALRLAEGLQGYTHLRVTQRVQSGLASMRLDLVDLHGSRFTIWEHFGRRPEQASGDPIWLALADFHPFSWGNFDGRRRLRPADIREIHLRFYVKSQPLMLEVEVQAGKSLEP